ncbi:MAG: hypothetical protein AAFY76_20325 [Cyanobacteria bacterium J06649_11]
MEIKSLAPILALLFFVIFVSFITFKDVDVSKSKKIWIFPAVLSILFLIFSLFAVITEGSLGFWSEHTRSLWGNQIWFDLLFAASIGWFLVIPRIKAVEMNPLLWLILVVSTGCIGFLAMISRMLYLEEKISD